MELNHEELANTDGGSVSGRSLYRLVKLAAGFIQEEWDSMVAGATYQRHK